MIADSSDCGADYELLKKILEVYPYYDKYGGANITEISYWLDAGLTQYYGDERIDITGFDYESFSDKFPYQISDEGINKGIEENKKIKIKYTKYDPETRKSYSEQLYPVVAPTTYEPTDPSTKPEPDPNVNYGDVDGDGEPGVSDVIFCNKAVVQSVLLSDDEKKAADVNIDGNVDGLDATLILQYAVNKIDSLPTAVCVPSKHYMIDLTERVEEIKKLVDSGKYFTINRARQYGKTTTLTALYYTLQKDYTVVSLSFKGISDSNFASEQAFVKAFCRKLLRETRTRLILPDQVKEQISDFLSKKEEQAALNELYMSAWYLPSGYCEVMLSDADNYSDSLSAFGTAYCVPPAKV